MSWLSELVDHGLGADDLAERLTAAGIKVEAIDRISKQEESYQADVLIHPTGAPTIT